MYVNMYMCVLYVPYVYICIFFKLAYILVDFYQTSSCILIFNNIPPDSSSYSPMPHLKT